LSLQFLKKVKPVSLVEQGRNWQRRHSKRVEKKRLVDRDKTVFELAKQIHAVQFTAE
jgi:hypothetical protein